MKAIYLSFLHLLRFIHRDMMLLVVLFAPLLCMLCYRFLIPALELFLCDMLQQSAVIVPYYPLLNIFFCMLAPAMFCFAAAMILLEERDEHTAGYLMITPLQRLQIAAACHYCLYLYLHPAALCCPEQIIIS